MRPLVRWASSIARSTAQSECCELSTGTKTSLYMSPRGEGRRMPKNRLSIASRLLAGQIAEHPAGPCGTGLPGLCFCPVPTRERAAFLLRDQASYCAAMGSPLYAHLLEHAAEDAATGGPVFALVEPFDAPNLRADALALRLMAAVHRLVLSGAAPRLAAHYPTAGGRAAIQGAWAAFQELV